MLGEKSFDIRIHFLIGFSLLIYGTVITMNQYQELNLYFVFSMVI